MPGNIVLPLADLPGLPFSVIGIVAIMQGNIFSSVIATSVYLGFFGFLVNSDVAAIFTEAAINVSAIPASAGSALVTSFVIGNNPVAWLVYKAFVAPEGIRVLTIAAAFACYFILYFFFQKNRKAWQIAAGATEEYFMEKEAIWKQIEEQSK